MTPVGIVASAKEDIENWLEEHPEATTSVQDGSIDENKLSSGLKNKIDEVSQMSESIIDIKEDIIKYANSKDAIFEKEVVYVTSDIEDSIMRISVSNGAKFVGNNIFDASTKKFRKIINDAGAEVDDYTSSYYEQYIPVSDMIIKSNFPIQRAYLYRSDKSFIRRTTQINGNTPTSFEDEVKFIRIQIANATESSTMCVVYGNHSTDYTPYYYSETNRPIGQNFSVFSDGVSNCKVTLTLNNFLYYVPEVDDYPSYEPQTVTDEYKCTPLGQNSQSIPKLTNELKYLGFLDEYYNIYLGKRKDGYEVSREDLGLDSGAASSTHFACPVYSYEFKPKAYNKTVLLSAGMNTCETASYFGLAYFIKELMEHSDKGMKALYNSTRFIVIPVICPSGILNNPLLYENSNGVRINKNFEYFGSWERLKNQNGGAYPDSEVETRILKYWLNKYNHSALWLDCHCDTAKNTVDLWLGGGFTSNTELTTFMTLNKSKIYEFYRSKGYYGAGVTPHLDYATMNKTNCPYPKTVYSEDVTGTPAIMFEQYQYSTAYGSDGNTNNDSYGIKHYMTMIRHIVLLMCKDSEKWVFVELD